MRRTEQGLWLLHSVAWCQDISWSNHLFMTLLRARSRVTGVWKEKKIRVVLPSPISQPFPNAQSQELPSVPTQILRGCVSTVLWDGYKWKQTKTKKSYPKALCDGNHVPSCGSASDDNEHFSTVPCCLLLAKMEPLLPFLAPWDNSVQPF